MNILFAAYPKFGISNPWQDPQAPRRKPKTQQKSWEIQPQFTRFKLNPDETAILLTSRVLEELSQKMLAGPVILFHDVQPARWAGEIGYHCDFAKTVLIQLGDEEFYFDKTGYKDAPSNTISYELRSKDGPFSLEIHDNFLTVRWQERGQPEQKAMLTVNSNQTGWQGEKGTAMVAVKQPILDAARQLMETINTRINQVENPFFA